jgi:hypothetical protein
VYCVLEDIVWHVYGWRLAVADGSSESALRCGDRGAPFLSIRHKSVRRVVTLSVRIVCIGSVVLGSTVGDAKASDPERISNATPYRVSKPPVARGRSGTATLTSRALQRKTGETDVELSTGDLDANSAASGSISGAQIATTDGRGRRQMVKEYPNLEGNEGYLAFTYTGLPRGQAIQVVAQVVDVDGARTDIVSAAPTVKLRPDLFVQRVSAPSKTVPGVPVVITATIAELNQDVGARASCVLSVDGIEGDRADAIWVDAAGLVSCAFTHTFATPGTKSVSVQVANVTPSDYDTANNAAATPIVVRSIEPFDYYQLTMGSDETRRGSHIQDWSTRNDGSIVYGRDYESNSLVTQWTQVVDYYAEVRQAFDLNATQLSVTESTAGAVVRSFHLDDIASEPNGCVSRYPGTEPTVSLYICQRLTLSGPLTTLRYFSTAGEVTYFSFEYDHEWHRAADGTVTTDSSYSWNDAGGSRTGTPVRWGSTYSIDVALTSPDAIYQGPLTASLITQTISNSTPWACGEWNADWGSERWCGDSTDERILIGGYTSNR